MNALPHPVEASCAGHQNDMLRSLAEHYVGPRLRRRSRASSSRCCSSPPRARPSPACSASSSRWRATARSRAASARLNRFGVPAVGARRSVDARADRGRSSSQPTSTGLAALYAIGVVGAIALNCYASGRSKSTEGVRSASASASLAVSALMVAIWVTTWRREAAGARLRGAASSASACSRATASARTGERVHPVEKVPFPPGAPRHPRRQPRRHLDRRPGLRARGRDRRRGRRLPRARGVVPHRARARSAQPDPAARPGGDGALRVRAQRRRRTATSRMRTFYDISTRRCRSSPTSR